MDVDWGLLISFMTRQFGQATNNHTFVSFNYDLVLERGIQLEANGNVDPKRMFAFPINMQAISDPPSSMDELGGGPLSALPVLTLPNPAMAAEISSSEFHLRLSSRSESIWLPNGV